MLKKRLRVYLAGVAAFLLGMPLTAKVLAGTISIWFDPRWLEILGRDVSDSSSDGS